MPQPRRRRQTCISATCWNAAWPDKPQISTHTLTSWRTHSPIRGFQRSGGIASSPISFDPGERAARLPRCWPGNWSRSCGRRHRMSWKPARVRAPRLRLTLRPCSHSITFANSMLKVAFARCSYRKSSRASSGSRWRSAPSTRTRSIPITSTCCTSAPLPGTSARDASSSSAPTWDAPPTTWHVGPMNRRFLPSTSTRPCRRPSI